MSVSTLMALTFPFQEVEGAEKATGGGHPRLRLSGELGKLISGKVYESSDIAQYQFRENLWMLMSQPLHKEVWVKDHGLACVWLFLPDKHTAFCPPIKEKQTVGWVHFEVQ